MLRVFEWRLFRTVTRSPTSPEFTLTSSAALPRFSSSILFSMSDVADSFEFIRVGATAEGLSRDVESLTPSTEIVAGSNAQLWPPRTVKQPHALHRPATARPHCICIKFEAAPTAPAARLPKSPPIHIHERPYRPSTNTINARPPSECRLQNTTTTI